MIINYTIDSLYKSKKCTNNKTVKELILKFKDKKSFKVIKTSIKIINW